MEFRIAVTFTDSLGRLTAQEQKAVKTTAFDLQMDPSAPGLSFHKLDRAKDTNFWSVRVNADIRLIVDRTSASLLLAYVDHHDAAYKWAERRKIERHQTAGAMQLVEVRERIEEIEIFRTKEVDAMLERRKALSDDHFETLPDEINWGDVGTLNHYASLLRLMPWLVMVGLLLFGVAGVTAGYLGVPRRVIEVSYGGEAPALWPTLMAIVAVGGSLMALALLIFAAGVAVSLVPNRRPMQPRHMLPTVTWGGIEVAPEPQPGPGRSRYW